MSKGKLQRCPFCFKETKEIHLVVEEDGGPVPMCPDCALRVAQRQANKTGKTVHVHEYKRPKK